MPKKRFGKAKMKKMWCSFRPWFSSLLINKTRKMYETAIPMGKMLNAFLAIHGRCKFIIFLRGQTPSLSTQTLILSLLEPFQGKAKNTVKHSTKPTFSISIPLTCNLLPGNPQPWPYIYIYAHIYIYKWLVFSPIEIMVIHSPSQVMSLRSTLQQFKSCLMMVTGKCARAHWKHLQVGLNRQQTPYTGAIIFFGFVWHQQSKLMKQ